jgi:hypothetical protein
VIGRWWGLDGIGMLCFLPLARCVCMCVGADESSANSMDFIPITKADGPLEYGWDLERRVSAGAHGEEIVRGFWADGDVSLAL